MSWLYSRLIAAGYTNALFFSSCLFFSIFILGYVGKIVPSCPCLYLCIVPFNNIIRAIFSIKEHSFNNKNLIAMSDQKRFYYCDSCRLHVFFASVSVSYGSDFWDDINFGEEQDKEKALKKSKGKVTFHHCLLHIDLSESNNGKIFVSRCEPLTFHPLVGFFLKIDGLISFA